MWLLPGPFFLNVLGVILALFGAIYVYMKNVTYNYWTSRGVVQDSPQFPFGILLPLFAGKKSVFMLFKDLYQQHKKEPYVGLYGFGWPMLMINDLDLARFVFTQNFSNFTDRGMPIDEEGDPLSAHLAALRGDKWRRMRSQLTSTFTPGKIKQMFKTISECGERLSEVVAKDAQKDGCIEIADLAARFTTDVIVTTVFGNECNSLEDPNCAFREWGRQLFRPRGIRDALFAFLCPKSIQKHLKHPTDKMVGDLFTKMFEETVQYRRSTKVSRNDFIDVLVQLMDKGYIDGSEPETSEQSAERAHEPITILQAAAQALVFYTAGFETSSNAIACTMYEICQDQAMQDRLSEEVNGVLRKYGRITYESLNEMTYLNKVIAETLRKHPPAGTVDRICTNAVTLPGSNLRIEKGMRVVMPIFGYHWNPDIFPIPEKFDPERFSDEAIASRHKYAYLPFGGGPRNCIGARFANAEMKVGLANLVAKYRYSPGPVFRTPFVPDTGSLIYSPMGGIRVKVEKR